MMQNCRGEENVTMHPVLRLCLISRCEGKHDGKMSRCTKAIYLMLYYSKKDSDLWWYIANTCIYPFLMFSYF